MKLRGIFGISCLLGALLLGGCAEMAEQDKERGFGGYLYTAEEIPADLLAGEQGIAEKLKCQGDFLYYFRDGSIYRHPLDTDTDGGRRLAEGRSQMVVEGKGGSLMDYTVSENGDVFYLIASISWSYNDGNGPKVTRETLIRQKGDGGRVYSFPVDGPFSAAAGGAVALDGRGHTFLLAGDTLYVVDGEGTETARISMEEYAPDSRYVEARLLEGPEGKVYYCADTNKNRLNSRLEVYEVTEENNVYGLKLLEGEGWEDREVSGQLFCSPWGLLHNGLDGILRRYDRAEGAWRELLRWSDSSLVSNVIEIAPFSEEGMFVYCGELIYEPELYVLTRRPAEEVPEKVELVLAGVESADGDLERAVAAFNRMSGDIHITIEIYTGSEAEMQLDAAIVSSDPPDLLDLGSIDIVKYAESQALEDLTPYLEASAALDREMFLENVLEGSTFGGRLVCIPARYDYKTVIGRKRQAGAEPGWDMEEMMAFAEGYSDHRLMGYQNFSSLLDLCEDYIMESYIDWEEGRCSFESDGFCCLMEWLAKLGEDPGELAWSLSLREDMLLVMDRVSFLYAWLYMEEWLGEPYVLKGFPTQDGRALHHGIAETSAAILAGSSHKEEAWRFLEYLLGEHQEGRREINESFSSRRDLLDKMVEEVMMVEYRLDDDGNTVDNATTESGPSHNVKWKRYVDGRLEDCYGLSREEADEILELLGSLDFSPRSAREREILGIITEEMESYQKGYKSMEEVAAVIQNRAEVLLQEHRR